MLQNIILTWSEKRTNPEAKLFDTRIKIYQVYGKLIKCKIDFFQDVSSY